ncbi:hypothetical protein F5148DRAFT_861632 [Russula earlei]|uniref:Uncharacterized protein n=1 Tax=Russula earlei TaxID=71964 RepID=A0ACC0UBU4_9AGAM|nr:hypothetical protein F5148DRAFT_861632 [Russula earlei]
MAHRHPLFASETGTAIPIPENLPAARSSPPQSQNTSPWAFPSHSSPSSLPSPSSYHLSAHSNNPSPADSASSDYRTWITSFEQQQQQHHLALARSSSYPPQPSTADHRHPRQTQPTTRNQYHFVPQHPLPTTSDAFNYFPSLPIDERPPHSHRQHSAPDPLQQQGWPPELSHPSDSNYIETLISQYPLDPQNETHTQHLLAPGSALTPASDHASLPTTSHISPIWTSTTLPSPGAGSSNTPTVMVHPRLRRGGNSAPPKTNRRKRHRPDTDEDEDEDMVGANVDPNLPQSNTNRLYVLHHFVPQLSLISFNFIYIPRFFFLPLGIFFIHRTTIPLHFSFHLAPTLKSGFSDSS